MARADPVSAANQAKDANVENRPGDLALAADWDLVGEIASTTMERLRQQPFKVVALEIDGKQVWPQAAPTIVAADHQLTAINERLVRVEAALDILVARQVAKEWYSTDEFAMLVNKAGFTVREWCRLGRIHAEKRGSGRGKFCFWVVSHQELLRYQREGLLPLRSAASSSLTR